MTESPECELYLNKPVWFFFKLRHKHFGRMGEAWKRTNLHFPLEEVSR